MSMLFVGSRSSAERHVRELGGQVGVCSVREGADGQRHRSGLAQLGPESLCSGGSEDQGGGTGDCSIHRLDRGQNLFSLFLLQFLESSCVIFQLNTKVKMGLWFSMPIFLVFTIGQYVFNKLLKAPQQWLLVINMNFLVDVIFFLDHTPR